MLNLALGIERSDMQVLSTPNLLVDLLKGASCPSGQLENIYQSPLKHEHENEREQICEHEQGHEYEHKLEHTNERDHDHGIQGTANQFNMFLAIAS